MINYITYLIVLIALTPVNTLEVSPFAVPASKWKYEIPITIQESQIPGTTDWTGYPMYINLSSLGTHFWTYVKAGGADIRVFDTDGTSELPVHVLSFTDNGTSGTGSLFVKVTLDADADKAIYLRYGNPSATAYAAGDTYGQNNVWTALTDGWALTEASGTLASLKGGTTFDVLSGVTNMTGKLEKQAITKESGTTIAENAAAINFATNMSVMAWIYTSGHVDAAWYVPFGTESRSGNDWWELRASLGATNLAAIVTRTTSSNSALSSAQIFSSSDDDTWVHFAWTNNSGTSKIYKNAVSQSLSDNSTNSSVTTSSQMQISIDPPLGLDMLIIFNSTLSDNHMTTIYNNQNAPNSFKSVAAPRSLWLPQSIN